MNFFGIPIGNSIQQGIAYVMDPAHRLLFMIIAGIFLVIAAKFVFHSIKTIFLIGFIIAAIFFGIQFIQNAI